MARGIERRAIFSDPPDYQEFIERLEESLKKSACRCLAWVLMPNHFHLLIQAGKEGTPPLMRRLMTGYAGYFNWRHRRSGHLFQNRYKAILCEEEAYLMELVRYIHLNPLRGKVVESLETLDQFRWSGHRALLGLETRAFQEVGEVWERFGKNRAQAQTAYRQFVNEGAGGGRRADLTGGGLLRSLGRSPGQWEGVRKGDLQASDARILGSGGFVEGVLKELEKTAAPSVISGMTLDELKNRVAKVYGLLPEELSRKGRKGAVTHAKAALIYLGTQFKGQTCQSMGQLTAMTVQSASAAKFRGEVLVRDNSDLQKLIN
ncbi:MAG: transposase [Elusimicrobia bacterium]|nr:transposase [Elusimicrobiota bacterium]